jgi:hypothetical protein
MVVMGQAVEQRRRHLRIRADDIGHEMRPVFR